MLQLAEGDFLFVYDVQNHKRTKMAELDFNFSVKKKTVSSIGSMLIHFSTDEYAAEEGFEARIHHIPSNADCADFLHEMELILTQVIDCNWIITAPSVTSTITIQFQFFEVYMCIRDSKGGRGLNILKNGRRYRSKLVHVGEADQKSPKNHPHGSL